MIFFYNLLGNFNLLNCEHKNSVNYIIFQIFYIIFHLPLLTTVKEMSHFGLYEIRVPT